MFLTCTNLITNINSHRCHSHHHRSCGCKKLQFLFNSPIFPSWANTVIILTIRASQTAPHNIYCNDPIIKINTYSIPGDDGLPCHNVYPPQNITKIHWPVEVFCQQSKIWRTTSRLCSKVNHFIPALYDMDPKNFIPICSLLYTHVIMILL